MKWRLSLVASTNIPNWCFHLLILVTCNQFSDLHIIIRSQLIYGRRVEKSWKIKKVPNSLNLIVKIRRCQYNLPNFHHRNMTQIIICVKVKHIVNEQQSRLHGSIVLIPNKCPGWCRYICGVEVLRNFTFFKAWQASIKDFKYSF